MSLRYASQLQVDLMPDTQTDNQFEVLMPFMNLLNDSSTSSGSRSNNFWGAVGSMLTSYCPIVESIVFSPQAFNSSFARIQTDYWGFPQDKQSLKNVTITMYLDVGNLALYYVEAWKNLMFNKGAGYYYSPQRYKKDIAVIMYGIGGVTPSAMYYLRGCFPIETSPIELKYSKDPKRLTITQTFSVDRVEYDDDMALVSILEVLTTSNPLGIVADQAAAATSNLLYGLNQTSLLGFLGL